MKCHEPAPPLLFTMIMNAMVMPRTTSSEMNRCMPVLGAVAGLVMVGALAGLVIGGIFPEFGMHLRYALGPWFAKRTCRPTRTHYHRCARHPTKFQIYSSAKSD